MDMRRKIKRIIKWIRFKINSCTCTWVDKMFIIIYFSACYKNNMRTYITLHEYFTVCPNGGIYNYKKGRICDVKPNSLECLFCNCDKEIIFRKYTEM